MKNYSSTLFMPESGLIYPVLVVNQHSGKIIPPDVELGIPFELSVKGMSDLFIDDLLADIPSFGIPVLQQDINRIVIDTNRSEGDISEAQISSEFRNKVSFPKDDNHGSFLVTKGKGLIPQNVFEDWNPVPIPGNYDLSPHDLHKRKEDIYRPFHQKLADILNNLSAIHGGYLVLDIHSYERTPSVNSDIVIGHLDGNSCESELSQKTIDAFSSMGFSVVSQRYLQGGYVTKKYSNPSERKNVIMIEIARDLFAEEPEFTSSHPEKLYALKSVLEHVINDITAFSLGFFQTRDTNYFQEPDQDRAPEQHGPITAQ